METVDNIRGALRKFNAVPLQNILAQVTDVDIDNKTCTVIDDGVEYYEVALQACDGGGDGVVLIPKIGSYILMARIEDSDAMWCVTATTDIEKVIVKIADVGVEIDSKGVVVNGGKNGGIVKERILQRWMVSVYQDLQTMAGAFNALGVSVVVSTQIVGDELTDNNVKH